MESNLLCSGLRAFQPVQFLSWHSFHDTQSTTNCCWPLALQFRDFFVPFLAGEKLLSPIYIFMRWSRFCAVTSSRAQQWLGEAKKILFHIRGNICHAETIKYEPLATGDTIKIFASAAPCPCPIKVTMFGLPLNAGRFSRSQWSPATRSMSPKFPWALPFVPVFRNPAKRKRNKEELETFHHA